MPYKMKIYCDGGCRGNGKPGSIGAAAIIFKKEKKTWRGACSVSLPQSPRPTNQRAELMAVILALRKALDKFNALKRAPYLELTIYLDSMYVRDCMTVWKRKWQRNGFTNSRGVEVVNRDLLEWAYRLEQTLLQEGTVEYEWIARERNWRADALANANMNGQ